MNKKKKKKHTLETLNKLIKQNRIFSFNFYTLFIIYRLSVPSADNKNDLVRREKNVIKLFEGKTA